MSMSNVFSVCGMCPVRCPIEAETEGGQCRFIQGNRYVPGIKGALCTRGAAGIPFIRDTERPQFPMIRTGDRGSGRWQRISWDKAFAIAGEKINAVRQAHGGRAILWHDIGGLFSDLRQAFVRGLNSPNFYTEESIDGANRQNAALSLFGFTDEQFVLDLENAKETVLQARNLFESVNIKQANQLMNSLTGGGRLTVIDIRSTVTSGKANRFFMIRPGTDYVFNLAVIHTLIARKWYQKSFVDTWIHDLEALEKWVAEYTPEFAERETGVKAESIVKFAEDLAKAAPAVVWHPGWRSDKYKDSYFVCRTAFIINALLGSIGARGGLALANAPEDLGIKGIKKFTDLFPKVKEARADGGMAEPFARGPGLLQKAYQAIETSTPYAIKGLITYQQDPLSDMPDPVRMKSLLDQLDFSISITSTWSETAWNADLILPLSAYLERESILGQQNGLQPGFWVRKRCVQPRFETLSDWEIVTGLAKEAGIQTLVLNSVEDIWKYQLNDTSVRMSDFDEKGFVAFSSRMPYGKLNSKFQFPTESGKIEIMDGIGKGFGGLEAYVKKPKPTPGSFRLTIGGCAFHSGGYTVNNTLLNRQMAENVLWMNQKMADQMGIEDGAAVMVSVQNRKGQITVRLTEYIHPEAVFIVPGFGRSLPVESRAFGKGLAANMLMPGGLDLVDSVGGGLALQEQFVEVRKI